jgi:hypothetical protein
MVDDPEDHVRDREEDDDTEKVFHQSCRRHGGSSLQLYFSRVGKKPVQSYC